MGQETWTASVMKLKRANINNDYSLHEDFPEWEIFNAAFVHGKFTFLSGEICASCDRRFMRRVRRRFNRLTKGTRHICLLWGGYESRKRETQNRQRLMIKPIAPFMETCGVSTQKSAEGIVMVGAGSPRPYDEGLNAEMSEAIS